MVTVTSMGVAYCLTILGDNKIGSFDQFTRAKAYLPVSRNFIERDLRENINNTVFSLI